MTTYNSFLYQVPPLGAETEESCPFCGSSVLAGATVCRLCGARAWDLVCIAYYLVALGALSGATVGVFLAHYLLGRMLTGVGGVAGFLGIGALSMHLTSMLIETKGETIWIRGGGVSKVLVDVALYQVRRKRAP